MQLKETNDNEYEEETKWRSQGNLEKIPGFFEETANAYSALRTCHRIPVLFTASFYNLEYNG
jgi:hypothetical protein